MTKSLIVLSALAMCVATAGFAEDANKQEKITMKVDKYFSEADSNNDGMISESEHAAAAKKKFDEADTNNDNMLTKAEKIAFKEKEKAEWKAAKPNSK